MIKVYLDFNIWNYINNDSKYREYFMRKAEKDEWKYFISVAHLEELYKAKRNEKHDSVGLTDKLENTIREIAEDGVIKPTLDGVKFKYKSYENTYRDIVNKDTVDIVYRRSLVRRDRDKNSYDSKDLFQGLEHNKNDEYKKVWDTERVKLELEKCNNNYSNISKELRCPQNKLRKDLIKMYGNTTGEIIISEFLESAKTQICPGIYNQIVDNYGKLEYVMEQLYFVLTKCGFKRDNKDKLANSGTYDIQHSICATMCDLFITNDYGFAEKFKAVAFYLAVPIRIMMLEDIHFDL